MLCGAQITIFVVLVFEIAPKIALPHSRHTIMMTYCMFQQPTHYDCHYSAKLMNKGLRVNSSSGKAIWNSH